jgi:hypothetical protein
MRRSTPQRPARARESPGPIVRRQHFSVNAGETPGGPRLRRVASVSYPGVGTEAGIAPVSGLRPGSRGSPPRRQPPVWWPRAPTISYPNLPGSGRFTSGPGNPFPADDGADALPPVGRTGRRRTSWACSIAPRLWVRPGGRAIPWGRDTAPGRWCRPCSKPRTYRRFLQMAQPANRWTVERPARRTGVTRRGPRPPGATWGHTQARQADTSQRPGASRSELLLSPHRRAGTPHERARGPGWFFNRNQKITPRGRPE